MGREKKEVLEFIRRLPDNVSTVDILEELYFKHQVDRGLQDVAEGRTLKGDEIKERIAKRRKSAGR